MSKARHIPTIVMKEIEQAGASFDLRQNNTGTAHLIVNGRMAGKIAVNGKGRSNTTFDKNLRAQVRKVIQETRA